MHKKCISLSLINLLDSFVKVSRENSFSMLHFFIATAGIVNPGLKSSLEHVNQMQPLSMFADVGRKNLFIGKLSKICFSTFLLMN